jgi:uncharacterized membrane protein YkvA (DUF1232 family)
MDNPTLVSRILSSIFFRRATGRAGRYVTNSASLLTLIRDALSKSGGLSSKSLAGFKDQVSLLARLVKASVSGSYREIPWQTLILIVTVLVYFVSPVDFLPDFLPLLGLTDDVALMLWLFSRIKSDLDKFSQWERVNKQQQVIPID